jgi:LPXTG-motif cell wall-anchored protein
VVFGLGLFSAGALLAQTQSSKVEPRNFEVLVVDGNRLVYRDQNGTHEITPPADFRLTVDGKKLAVKELKPGMKGTAIVTRTTTTTPVIVTEFRDAVVLSTTPNSVTVRGADGVRRRFTQAEIDKRGIEIFKDGRLIRVSQLNKGDQLTGTIISSQPPTVVTETEVEAKLATAKAEPAPAPAKAESAPAAPAATPPATVASATPAAPSAPPMKAAPPPEQSQSWLLWAAILIAIAVVVYLFMRKKKS